MTSAINPNDIDGTYPIAGQDNNSQGFRDNFTNTKTNFQYAANEITDLQGLCNWAIDLWPDVFTGDDAVKAALRSNGTKTWSKNTDVAALQRMLEHVAKLRTL